MRNLTHASLPPDLRHVLRPVTLAYRRTRRALDRVGMDARYFEPQALDAAYAEFKRLVPGATKLSRLEVSARANAMIAAAINANPDWFWRRPDAWRTALRSIEPRY